MTRFFSVLVGLALLATSSAQADVILVSGGAPNGSSGTAASFDADPNTGVGVILDTGIAADDLGGNRGGGSLGGDYTVTAWLNPNQTGQAWFLGHANGNGQGLHLGIGPGDNLFSGHWSADSNGGSTVPANQWTHATFTFDADGGAGGGGEQRIFLNGQLVSTAENPAPNRSSGNIVLGSRNNGGQPAWNGLLDDVGIWNEVISDADIASIFNGAAADTLGADAYYDFEDPLTSTTTSVSGSGELGATALTITAAVVVPEPSSLAIMLGLGAWGLVRRKRS